MWFVPLLLIGLVIWAFAGSRRHVATYGHMTQRGDEALEVLKLRLARGEITEDEYLRLKDTLTK